MNRLSLVCCTLALSTVAVSAQVLNVTSDGTPIMGLAISPAAEISGVDGLGNPVTPDRASYGYSSNGYVNGGMLRGNTGNTYTAITDGNLSTYGDTEYDGFDRTNTDGTAPMGYPFGSAYVGETGLSTISASTPVTTIKLNFALDLYGQPGSYFGDNGTGDVYTDPGNSYATLHLPATLTLFVQTTTDGSTWNNVAYSSDYTSVMNGLNMGTGGDEFSSPTVTFNISQADGSNIAGIRVIGTVGGGRDDGMLGVAEMAVETPEPSTYAMLALGTVALLGLARFTRRIA